MNVRVAAGLLSVLTLTASLAACKSSHNPRSTVRSAPSSFVVRPAVADPLCNHGRGVRLRAGLAGDPVVASATSADGSTLISFSPLDAADFAVVESVTRRCELDRKYGHDGRATIRVSAGLRQSRPPRGSPAGGLWVEVLVPRRGGGAIVAGTYRGWWAVGAITVRGEVDPTFGNGGWTLLPFRGAVTALLQEPSGRIVIGGDNGGGGCCTLNWAAALSERGHLRRGFGRHGRAELPTGEDSGVDALLPEPNGNILAKVIYGNMGCWGVGLAMLTPSGRPVAHFAKRLRRLWRRLGFRAFVGDVYVDHGGFTLVGTGQRPCADGPRFSASSATGVITRVRVDGSLRGATTRFPSRLYGEVDAFRYGTDTFMVESPYADSTRLTVTALRADGSVDPGFAQRGHAWISTPWHGFNESVQTLVSANPASPGTVVLVATRSGHQQLLVIRLRL